MKILPVCRRYYRVFDGSLVDLLINIVLSRCDCRPEVVVQAVQLLDRSGRFTITANVFLRLSRGFD